jgi:hypothetical protein
LLSLGATATSAMNRHIASRLSGIHGVLCSAFEAGASLSSSSKGYEREIFISFFLSEVLPPIYRFGTGDITDALMNGNPSRRSGQIDIVIEMPWAPSFPMPVGAGARLYPSEAVGTAIEVKSNLSTQWDEVIRTATELEPLRQRLSGISVDGGGLSVQDETDEPIPLYAVGYEGWSTAATVKEKAHSTPVDGVLVLKHKIFAWSDRRAFLQRLKRCQDELDKKQSDTNFDATTATCARVVNLIRGGTPPDQIVATLNTEQWAVKPVHFGDQEFLPAVTVGGWTAQNVEQLRSVFLRKTKVSVGIEALLQFIAVVHREVGKRAGMSVDLSQYAK